MKLEKYLINELNAKEIEYEIHEDAMLKIKKDCKKYISLLGNKHPFYRGVNYTLYSSNAYLKVQTRKNRESFISSRRVFSPIIDKLFKDHNIPLRSESVNTTSNLKHATFFSQKVYYMFPIGDFKYAYCTSKDFNNSGGNYRIFNFIKYVNNLVDWIDYDEAWNYLKDGVIANKNMSIAHDKGYEIWFDCKEYYLVPIKSVLAGYWNKDMVK